MKAKTNEVKPTRLKLRNEALKPRAMRRLRDAPGAGRAGWCGLLGAKFCSAVREV